jgi:hypothetical protein
LAAEAKDQKSKRFLQQAAQDWLHLAAIQRSLQSAMRGIEKPSRG